MSRIITYHPSKSLPETGFKCVEDIELVAKIRRARRWLCIGEEIRRAA